MAYEFKTLGSVEALTEVPENANALVEVDGTIKRVPGGALGGNGGGGGWDAVIASTEDLWSEMSSASLSFESGSFDALMQKLNRGEMPKTVFHYDDYFYEASHHKWYTPVQVWDSSYSDDSVTLEFAHIAGNVDCVEIKIFRDGDSIKFAVNGVITNA